MAKITRSLIGILFWGALSNNTVFSNEANQYKEDFIKSCSDSRFDLFRKYSIENLKSKSNSYCNCIYKELDEKFSLSKTNPNIKQQQQQFLMTSEGVNLLTKCHNNSFSFFETYKRNFINSCTITRLSEFKKDNSLTKEKLKANLVNLENFSFSYCYCLFLDSLKQLKIKPGDVNELDGLDSKLNTFFKSRNSNGTILNCEKKALTITAIKADNSN